MSMMKYVMVLCDKCGEESAPASARGSIRETRALAKSKGWKLGKSKDFCPDCAKDIAAKVAEAAAGNL